MKMRLKQWVAGKSEEKRTPQADVRDRHEPDAVSRESGAACGCQALPQREGPMLVTGTERPKILVALTQSDVPDCVAEYTVHLAERLHYDIVAMHVGNSDEGSTPLPELERFQEQYRKRTIKAAQTLSRKAGEYGIHCEHLVRFGNLGSTVGALQHEVKRIEFVITDSEVNKEDIFAEVTIPVFSVTPTYWWSEQGGKTMSRELAPKKSKPLAKTIMYGIAAAALYAGVFAYSDTVMKYFTRGSWYAALPIATVFMFSFVHGTFASNLWSLLGIEAKKKDTLQKTVEQVVQPKKQPRKKPRAHAYVNPWHRI
jgi:hypothetical protein